MTGNGSLPPPRWLRRGVPWLGAVFVAAIVAMAVWDIVRSYRNTVDDVGRELESQARIVAEQTARSLQSVDIVLRHVAGEHRRGRLARLSRDELQGYLHELSVGLKQIDGFGMYDAQGDAIALSWPAPELLQNIAELRGFKLLRDDPSVEFGIAAPTRSPADGPWMLPLGRPLQAADGSFAGVIGARGRVDYFQDFYRDVRLESGTSVALLHRLGTLLARFPPMDSSLGKRYPLFGEQLVSRADGAPGLARLGSPIDGAEHFGVLRWVPDYPLAVLVTRRTDDALAGWRQQAVGTAARTLALGLLAGLLLVVAARQFERLDAARAKLETTKNRFALAVAGSDDGIWDWDQTVQRVFASARARELLGLPPGPEMLPMDEWFSSLQFHPDDVPRRMQAIDDHFAGRTPSYEGEYRVRHPDGSYRWVRIRGLCVRDAQGNALRMAGSVSDIDARKRAEESLRLSEERYALAMAGLSGGHWVWELDTDALFVSSTLNELFGLPAELQPASRSDYLSRITLHRDDRACVTHIGEELVNGGTDRADFEFRIVLRGEVRWIMTRAQCFRDANGKAVRIAGVSVDATDRKRTEQALRESEDRFAAAVAGSDDGIWVWDFEADTAFESTRARELQGLPPGPELQPLPRLLDSLRVHPDDAPRRSEGIRAHLAGETPAYECEYRVRHDDGVYRWVRIRALCVRDADGKPVRLAGSVSDIDARKRAEEALRASEQRFALAVSGANDGILDWDIVADRMFASERTMRLVGLEPDNVLRTRAQWAALVMPRFHPDDLVRLKEELREDASRQVDAHEGEYRVRGADGEYHWLRFRGRTVRDADGRAVRWAGSVSDVDALKRVEEALRESEERYELAVAGSNEGMWDWDMRAETFFFSTRAQELVGLEPGEPLRPCQEWWSLFKYHPDDEKRVHDAMNAYLGGAGKHWEVEYRIRHQRSGAWHWYRERGVALRDAAGKPYRMAGSMEDISARKGAEEARDRLEAQLRQSQKLEAMGTLAGGIAHDFNNILAAILGYGEMAQKDAPDGSALRRHLDAAMSAGLRAKSLVERILAFSRSGMGERAPVHVQSVLDEALDAVAASLPRGIALERDIAAGDAAVLGDATQIHQVVLNLCANAAQAIRTQGVIGVEVTTVQFEQPHCVLTTQLAPGPYVRLTVRDSGSGIAPELLERIFDPFFTTKQVGVGTGLGLSLVHGIVADLGGGIDVQSQLGTGSTFTIYLPWQSCAEAPHAEPEAVANGNGETILLVDDEESLVRLGEEMMAELGYEPVGFASSAAALETFRAEPERFDAVLSDEAMPELTGSELAREIRRIRPDIPIVLMTGYATAALTARARDAGVTEVLAKPLVARDIARSLSSALHR